MKNRLVVKNTAMLYIMNIAKMLFPLITLPYLTRVLSVGCYGTVSYVKAIMQYMQITVDFGFMLSGTKDIVKIRKNPELVSKETSCVFFAKILMAVLAFLTLLCLMILIPILRENPLFTILSFCVVFLTCFLFDFLFRGLEEMHIITLRFLVAKSVSTLLTFVFVHGDGDILWIPILDIIGTIIAILLIVFELRKRHIVIGFYGVKAVLIKIKESFVYFLSDIATTAFLALNTVMVGIFLSKTDIAYWSVCMQLVGAVLSLYNPISNGVYPHMVKNKDIKLIRNLCKYFMPIVFAGCVFTYIVSGPVLVVFGGNEYKQAAYLLRTLIPVMFFGFPSIIFGWPVLGAIGREKENTFSTIVVALFQILGLVLLILSDSISLLSIAILRCITEALLFMVRYGFYRKYRNEFQVE